MPIARWRLDTPALNGYEDIGYGTESLEGVLSCSYGDNTDSRWRGELRLGPLVTTIDCDGADAAGGGSVGTPATVNAFAFSNGINAIDQLVVGRGTKLAAIKLSDRTQVMDGTMAGAGAPFAEAVTDLIYTKAANATEEISVGMDNTIYQVITALPATGGFTASANDESVKNRIFGLAGSDNAAGQVAGLGRGASGQNIARQNVMTGTVTMDASSWSTRATLSGEAVIFTGFALDGRFWIIGTSNGPYYLDSDGQRFRPLIDSIDNQLSAPTNCFGMRSWDLLGPAVICPLGRSVRVIKDLQSVSVGPEVFRTNTSPVQGRLGKSDGSEMWDYWPIYNTITGETYICAVRPRQPGDPHGNLLSYYPIITLTDTESKIVAYAGTRGGQANPTVYFGSGTDVSWFLEGRTNRFPDDGCFPADTTISLETLPVSVTKRWYTGELTEITTSLGHKLTGTPNHPILTDRGWVRLSHLTKGDHVAHDGLPVGREPLSDPDVKNPRPTIGQIFDLAAIGAPGHRRRFVRENFHGDGQEGEVDIKPINGELRDWLETFVQEPILDQHFVGRDVASLSSLKGSGSPLQSASGNVATTSRGPRWSQSGNLLIPRLLSEPQRGGSGEATPGNPSPLQVFVEGDRVDAELAGDAHSGFAGNVAFCDVVEVRRIPFSGHVYNLETESHRYSAEGIVAHNSYTYAASGTFYGTELRRYPEKRKKIVRVGFETKNCTSTETVTVSIVYRDHMNAAKTVALPARSSNGWQWLNMPSGGIEARAWYPTIALARGGTTTNSPVVVGDLVCEWEEVKD